MWKIPFTDRDTDRYRFRVPTEFTDLPTLPGGAFIVFWSGAGWIPCSNVAVRRQTPWRPDGTTLRIAMLAVAEGSPLSISDGGQGKSPWGVWVYGASQKNDRIREKLTASHVRSQQNCW